MSTPMAFSAPDIPPPGTLCRACSGPILVAWACDPTTCVGCPKPLELCPGCAGSIGGAAAGPDMPWIASYAVACGETPCEADDCRSECQDCGGRNVAWTRADEPGICADCVCPDPLEGYEEPEDVQRRGGL